MKKIHMHFPWFSVISFLLLSGIFLVVSNPPLIHYYHIPENWLAFEYRVGLFTIASFFALWDIRRFYRQRRRYEQWTNELFHRKKQLQQKAHSFSGHADKLKLFISDRLLEYIQYDEKFLHFKHIAAEVRHNGVICFDKVQNALSSMESMASAKEAQASMRYLWDLLDLSTTDNIALHVGNYLCECEEYYVQAQLRNEQAPPFPITYQPHQVLLECLQEFCEEENEFSQYVTNGDQSSIEFSNTVITAQLNTSIELLGNENHFRLLVENLLNNAQFYARKRKGSKALPTIAVILEESEQQCQLAIYNRGQNISSDNLQKIFQLGYSSRRKKEHHGKGLGLYFVNSITQGYEGHIAVNNIENVNDHYSIHIETNSGEIITDSIEVTLINDQPTLVTSDNSESKNSRQWIIKETVKAIEVFSENTQKTVCFTDITDDIELLTDPDKKFAPYWEIALRRRRKTLTIQFALLDRRGVEFIVTLPTVEARLNYTYDDDNSEPETNYESLIEMEKRFQ